MWESWCDGLLAERGAHLGLGVADHGLQAAERHLDWVPGWRVALWPGWEENELVGLSDQGRGEVPGSRHGLSGQGDGGVAAAGRLDFVGEEGL